MSEAPATVDHYATLGVSPKAEDVVVRAAYLALMRRYHPDKDGSPESSERAQAIIAAFAVLGDYKTRVKYDWARRRAAEALARPAKRRMSNRHWALIAVPAVALLAAPLAFMRTSQPSDDLIVEPSVGQREPTVVRYSPPRPVTVTKAGPIEPPLAKAPLAAKRDEPAKLAAVGAKAVAPRPVADPSPRVLAQARPVSPAPRERQLALAKVKPAKPAASASDKCSSAKPGADKAICKDDNLAALDRLNETYYGQSVRVGNATKRAALQVSRDGFIGRREACRTDSCLRDAYVAHNKEISAIVENRQSAPR